MLQEEVADLGHKEFISDLRKIHGAAKHQLGLINEILDLSKIEAGKMTLYLETFDIGQMVKEVTATIHPLVLKNSNRLAVDCPAGIGSMHADLTKVRQALFNLLSNACKFTENGTVQLQASRQTDEGKDWITFHVIDSSIGMTPDQLGRLFESFNQGDTVIMRKYGGTGLGLAISRRFCRLMGGDSTVTSELGKGSAFSARLPAEVPELQGG